MKNILKAILLLTVLTFAVNSQPIKNSSLLPCFTKITNGVIVNDNAWGEGCAWGDYDNDGDQDLVVTNFNDGCHSCNYPVLFYRNDIVTFSKITTGPIATEVIRGFGCTWGDYDNDGKLDLFITAGWDPPSNDLLYHNEGGGNFTKITNGSIVNSGGSSQSCAWIDYDRDGWLDMFVVNGNSENDFLFHNDGTGSFIRITSGSIVNDGSYGRSVCTGDYDNDGWPDIFITCFSGQTDRLYRNNGNGTFSLTSGVVPADNSNGSGCAFGDYDNDGWLDLIVTNLSGSNFLYHNEGNGTFSRIFSGPGSEGAGSFGATWADYDNDGRLDLYIGNYNANSYLYKNLGGGSFVKVTDESITNEVTFAIGTSAVDFDMNGKMDFFAANNGIGSPSNNDLLYQNNCTAGNYIGIKLKGCTSNKCGIGSRIIVKASGNTYIREVSGGSGYHSQDMLWQLVGVGNASIIDSVIVKWTTGNIQRISNVSINQYILVEECLIGLISNTTEIPQSFSLSQNSPNPFNPSTKIKFTLPQNSAVKLQLFDNLGKEVSNLIDKELSAGFFEYEFDGSSLSSGIYFYRLSTEKFVSTKKMVLIK